MAYTNDSIWKSVDWMTICIYLMLVIFGWFSVCGASYDYGEIDFFSFDTRAVKQFVWICCSLGLGFILMMLEDKLYDMFAYILYGGMMLLLLITPFLAEDTKGSYSWIKFGPVSLQPAEFAKFATALALAKFMNVYGFTMSKLVFIACSRDGVAAYAAHYFATGNGVGFGLSGFLFYAVPGGDARFYFVCWDLRCGLFCSWDPFWQ